MVGQHPELAGLPELKLFLYPTIGELDASLPLRFREAGVAHRSPGLVRAVAQFEFGGQSAEAVGRALRWLHARAHWTGADVLDQLQARAAPRRAVEKSPETVMTSAALQRMAVAYPRASYIHLTRHPSTSARSMAKHWSRTMPAAPVVDPETTWLATWAAAHDRILAFSRRLAPERCLRVRAEDVLGDAERQLERIARWLGVRCDAEAMTAMLHPEESVFACSGPRGSGVSGGQDPAFLADPALRTATPPPPLERPVRWSGGAALWAHVVELADELGYGGAPEAQVSAMAAAEA